MEKEKVIIGDVIAAITMALHEEMGYTSHISESGLLTVEEKHTEWNSKQKSTRQAPHFKP